MSVTVAIADDHDVLRAGLRRMLALQPDLEIVGEARDGESAVLVAETLRPDVLVADISMPDPNGIEVARILRSRAPSTAVLILTMHEDVALIHEAVAAGAKGYVRKRSAEQELAGAVRILARGGTFLPPDCLSGEIKAKQAQQPRTATRLAPSELAFVRLVVQGFTNGKIATELNLSSDAIAELRARLAEKLGAYSRVDLVRFAEQNSLF